MGLQDFGVVLLYRVLHVCCTAVAYFDVKCVKDLGVSMLFRKMLFHQFNERLANIGIYILIIGRVEPNDFPLPVSIIAR